MTASTPNPADSGAAASRDAARTARRLTDGTLPRTSPPDPDQLRERTPAPALAPDPGPPTPTPTPTAADAPDASDAPEGPGSVPGASGAAPVGIGAGAVRTAPVSGGPGLVAAGSVSAAAPVSPVSLAGPVSLARPVAGGSEAGVPEPAPAPGGDGPAGKAAEETVGRTDEVTGDATADLAAGKTADVAVGKAADVTVARTGDESADKTAAGETTAPAPAPHALDFGRIKGVRVGSVAVPVAAVVRVARRKNVIGTETTGSIPVHLLFRDEPETAVPRVAGDDGGPDTISMDAPTPPATGRKPAIPAPSKVQAPAKPDPESRTESGTEPRPTPGSAPKSAGRPTSPLKPRPKVPSKTQPTPQADSRPTSRPAPTADPALVERPGPVLPGWVGVVGGALAVAGCAAVVWWAGAVPAEAARMLRLPTRPYHGIPLGQWVLLALGVVLALFSLGGLGRGRVGYAWVLTLYGDYRGTVRRTGLLWVSPLLLRRRVDVRLRHWRSEPLSAVDAKGTALDVTVLVVWRVRDTVRAALGVDGHEEYLREQVEAAMARVLSQLPADAFHEDAPTLRDAEAVGEALTRMLSAECAPVGVDVFSAQPTRIEYAPEVAAAMRRRRIAAIDAKHRDSVLTSVVDAVDDVVHRLTSRGLVELDDYERKALVKDLTVAFYTGRTGPVEGA
ncbi:SPFH domain-containing protein [Streptomyces sp. NPDC056549]|uniref:SPFH domain-containing protein n=1 Tax=Streptomyces sp. NPDC056549 TaxID=3345864 RepID=UPI0036CA2200